MKIIVKKVNKIEKNDFPDSVISLQIERQVTCLSQAEIEQIINKLIVFSERQQSDKQQQKTDAKQLNIAGVSSQRELLSKFAVFFAENMERGKTPAFIVDEFYEAFGNSC